MGKTMSERYNESMDNLMKMFGKMLEGITEHIGT